MTQPAVVFENSYFLAVDKPPEWLTIPPRVVDDRPIVVNYLREHFGETITPVHRLDAGVSGLLLFARTPESHRVANAWFEKRQVQKAYQAYSGESKRSFSVGDHFKWSDRLQRGKKRSFIADHGKSATTQAYVIQKMLLGDQVFYEWQLNPETGRTHQLRVHLAVYAGPIVGDALYGSTLTLSQPGIALRSFSLNFGLCQNAADFGLPPQLQVAPLIFEILSR